MLRERSVVFYPEELSLLGDILKSRSVGSRVKSTVVEA